jgi:hypothetical protein
MKWGSGGCADGCLPGMTTIGVEDHLLRAVMAAGFSGKQTEGVGL